MYLSGCCEKNENGEETYYSLGQCVCGCCGTVAEDDGSDPDNDDPDNE